MIELAGGVVIAVGSPSDEATLTLSDRACDDRRVVTVDSIPDAVADLSERCARHPLAAAVCDDVLRAFDPAAADREGGTFDRWAAAVAALPPDVQARVEMELAQVHELSGMEASAHLLQAAGGGALPGDEVAAGWICV